MKKSIIMLFCLFLIACNSSGIIIAETPEEALQKLDSKEDDFKINKILNSTNDNQKQGYYVFEGEVDNRIEWFVANVVTNDLSWYVKDFVNIGTPNNENETYSSGTDTFTAGLSNKPEDKKNDRIIVDIPENDYYVWIEKLENKK